MTIKKISLEPTLQLCAKLDNPHQKFKSVHIAGTNGKGSCSHIIASILQAGFDQIGLYTSPHYRHFSERIKINGNQIEDDEIINFIQEHKSKWEGVRTSFFELTVAMAFDYFSRKSVDYGIIETGLGGRLDSTNIINPVISVITNISYDHTEVLGSTLGAIAHEKAGIIKAGTPVVIGRKHPETDQIFIDRAKALDSPIYFAEDLYSVQMLRKSGTDTIYRIHDLFSGQSIEFSTDLAGNYQLENIRTSLASLKIMGLEEGFRLEKEMIREGLMAVKERVHFIGRWQQISDKPVIIADSAHNPEGIQKALEQANAYDFRRLHIVLGLVVEKDVIDVLRRFPKNAVYYFTNAKVPRALPASQLKYKALKEGLNGEHYDSVDDALLAAKTNANDRDLILVIGSIFVIAEVV